MPAKGIDLRPSGKFRARFVYQGHKYTCEWDTERQAIAWIQRTRRELVAGTYVDQDVTDPDTGKALLPTFEEYAAKWLEQRELQPRTRSEYRGMMVHAKPLERYRLDQLTPQILKDWHAKLRLPATRKAHVYGVIRAILNTAVEDEVIPMNPCRIKRAGVIRARRKDELPTPVQVHELADLMPSAKYRTMTLLTAWCGLRFGEATELRRKDVLLDEDGIPLAVRVRRGVVRVDGEFVVGTPKSAAGIRDVVIPPHIRGDVAGYLESLPKSPDVLLFPGTRNGTHMAPSSLYKPFYLARAKVGLPSLRWHDLRHFGATEAARAGATTAELMSRLGHSTYQASMRYQHAASDRDAEIAARMSNVVELGSRRRSESA